MIPIKLCNILHAKYQLQPFSVFAMISNISFLHAVRKNVFFFWNNVNDLKAHHMQHKQHQEISITFSSNRFAHRIQARTGTTHKIYWRWPILPYCITIVILRYSRGCFFLLSSFVLLPMLTVVHILFFLLLHTFCKNIYVSMWVHTKMHWNNLFCLFIFPFHSFACLTPRLYLNNRLNMYYSSFQIE